MMFKILICLLFFCGSYSFSFSYSNFFPSPQNYKPVSRPLNIEFPLDHGPHKDHAIEWWYITANLIDENSQVFGIQWTLFRSAINNDSNTKEVLKEENTPYWNDNQIWMGHAAVTSENIHYFEEKLARGGTGQSGVKGNEFLAWIDDWSLYGKNDWSNIKIHASGKRFEYSLNLAANGSIILHGDNGYSQKTKEGHSSAYYSQPFFKVDGKVLIDDDTFLVKGSAWADREWSSSILGSNQEGWDWFSLHLDTGEKLMVFRVRNKGSTEYYSGTLITKDKKIINLKNSEIIITPLTFNVRKKKTTLVSSETPMKWRIEIKNQDIKIITSPINNKAYNDTLIPYWEGPISFNGSHKGFGYLEMTGY